MSIQHDTFHHLTFSLSGVCRGRWRCGVHQRLCQPQTLGLDARWEELSPSDTLIIMYSVSGGVYVSAGGSVTHPAMPPQNKKVRGENGPTCWALRPVQSDPEMCLFQWLLDTDLKVGAIIIYCQAKVKSSQEKVKEKSPKKKDLTLLTLFSSLHPPTPQ